MGVCERLTLVARNREGRLDEVVAELEQIRNALPNLKGVVKTRIQGHAFDVRDRGGLTALLNQIYQDENDQIDAFVNSAGGSHVFGLLESMSTHDIDEIVDVNAKAPMYWLRELLPRMRCNRIKDGDLKRGHVLMLSSRSGERALPNLSVYAAAKGCVEKLVEAVRAEYASFRIAFTLVNPGSVQTSFTDCWPVALRDAHNVESMSVGQAISPIIEALNSQFSLNKISYESVQQWLGEPGVLVRSNSVE
jgi:NADP-dependent 3-hydroxy acid dehydrogenase YdfG